MRGRADERQPGHRGALHREPAQQAAASARSSRRTRRWRSGSAACASSTPRTASTTVGLATGRGIRRRAGEAAAGGGTQEALYRELDLELSWSERELPERERTKHVHRLHPYLGKFVPQLVEALLDRYVPAGRPCARPLRRLGDDARAGARVRLRRGRRRRRRLQRAARWRQDARATTSTRSRRELQRRARRGSAARAEPADRLRSRLVRPCRPPPSCCTSGRSSTELEHADVLARRPRARGALGAADDALRSRLPARAAAWTSTGATSTGACAGRSRSANKFLARYLPRHARADPRVRAACATRSAARSSCTATRASSSSAGRTTASSPRRRTRG